MSGLGCETQNPVLRSAPVLFFHDRLAAGAPAARGVGRLSEEAGEGATAFGENGDAFPIFAENGGVRYTGPPSDWVYVGTCYGD